MMNTPKERSFNLLFIIIVALMFTITSCEVKEKRVVQISDVFDVAFFDSTNNKDLSAISGPREAKFEIEDRKFWFLRRASYDQKGSIDSLILYLAEGPDVKSIEDLGNDPYLLEFYKFPLNQQYYFIDNCLKLSNDVCKEGKLYSDNFFLVKTDKENLYRLYELN